MYNDPGIASFITQNGVKLSTFYILLRGKLHFITSTISQTFSVVVSAYGLENPTLNQLNSQ